MEIDLGARNPGYNILRCNCQRPIQNRSPLFVAAQEHVVSRDLAKSEKV